MTILTCGPHCEHPCNKVASPPDGGSPCAHCGAGLSAHGADNTCIHVRPGDHGWLCQKGHRYKAERPQWTDDFPSTWREDLVPPHWPVSAGAARELIERAEKILAEYPEPPIRWEVAGDVYTALCRLTVESPLGWFGGIGSVPVVLSHRLAHGEWGPVFGTRKR